MALKSLGEANSIEGEEERRDAHGVGVSEEEEPELLLAAGESPEVADA